MTFQYGVFLFFAALCVYGALRVITARNPVHAALHLVLTFFAAAGLWILLAAEFLAITLVLVYVGAVMVLFLFVVMMLDVNIAELREGFVGYLPVGLLIGLALFVQLAVVLGPEFFGPALYESPPARAADYSNTAELGRLLYTFYVYPFEIAAAILLVAIVAAIALTMRRRAGVKRQTPARQVKVRAADRLKVIKMKPETADDSAARRSGGGDQNQDQNGARQ